MNVEPENEVDIENELKEIEENAWLNTYNCSPLFDRQIISQFRTLKKIDLEVEERFGEVDTRFISSNRSNFSQEKNEYNLVN